MDVGGVDHAVRSGRTAAQALEIVEGASMGLGARGLHGRGRLIRTGQADDVVSRVDQLGYYGGPDESARAGNEYAHD